MDAPKGRGAPEKQQSCSQVPFQETRATSKHADAHRLRVLVVDDCADAADSTSAWLETLGYDVRVAFDGRNAVLAAHAFVPQAVLLDIGLPDVDGYKVARHMRQSLENATLIAMTGWAGSNERARSAEAGFDHYFTKPLELEALEELLASLAALQT